MRLGKVLVFVLVLNLVCLQVGAKRGKGKKCRKNKNATGCARKKTRDRVTKQVHTVTSQSNTMKPLHCNCSYIHCAVPRRHLKCAGNVVKGVCGCCPTCAKQLGEECGGEMTFKGVCDVGMTCKVPSSNSRRSTVEIAVLRNGSAEEGTVCVATDTIMTSPKARESPEFDTCEPECTAEFCSQKQNKNAICSAAKVAVERQGCQQNCQHTSCRACFYEQERPACKKCGQGDFACIKSFADCAKKKTICKKNVACKRKKPKKHKGEFKCWVPQCT